MQRNSHRIEYGKMKLLLVLAVGCFAVAASIFDEDPTRIHGENGWYVPQINGSYEWMDMNKTESYLESMENIETLGLTISPVTFHLYTKSNPKKGKKITASIKSIKASNFNPAHPTRIIIHGWTQGYLAFMNKKIRNAWLSLGEHNVIVVDWARARSVDYATSVIAVPHVGKKVANMIDFLVKNYGMSLDTLNLIGHSLGAHVSGYAGKNVKTGKINTIIGLDPALPLFNFNTPKKRLSITDAVYVESIHTNGGQLGFLKPLGKASFYPNGGRFQPDCLLDITGVCAHLRAVIYYAEAVALQNYGAKKCQNFKYAIAKDCGSNYSSVRMAGDKNALMAAGDFYVPVKEKAPFGILD